jgi:hypothetical protein
MANPIKEPILEQRVQFLWVSVKMDKNLGLLWPQFHFSLSLLFQPFFPLLKNLIV